MRWRGYTDGRATLTRRYLEGDAAAIHPAGASENVEAAEISGWNESGKAVEAERGDDTGDGVEAAPEPDADTFEPGLRGAALMKHDQKQLNALLERAKQVLGSEEAKALTQSKARLSIFSTMMDNVIRAQGEPSKVTDEQIATVFQATHKAFPESIDKLL